MRRVRQAMVGLGLCAVIAACSTEPATDIGKTRATLNGTGSAAQTPVTYTFELATDSADLGTTRARSVPAGTLPANTSLRPIAKTLTDLSPGTAYTYRLCGKSGTAAQTCFQERSFRTPASLCGADTSCYAELTDITRTAGKLRAGGFESDEPLVHWFLITDIADQTSFTTPERGPERLGTAGAFSDATDRLEPDSSYWVQGCVRTPAGETVCSQLSGFFTPGPVIDTCGPGVQMSSCWTVARDLTATSATFGIERLQLARPARVFLRYKAGDGALGGPGTQTTPDQDLPASASEAVASVTGLTPDTVYSFQLCVRPAGGGAPECPVTSGFKTLVQPPPYPRHGGHVRITGGQAPDEYGLDLHAFDVDVRTDADGSHPVGRVSVSLGRGNPTATGPVTCMNVIGAKAVITFRYRTTSPGTFTIFVEDKGGNGKDIVDAFPFERDAEDCSPNRGETFHPGPLTTGRAIVEQAP